MDLIIRNDLFYPLNYGAIRVDAVDAPCKNSYLSDLTNSTMHLEAVRDYCLAKPGTTEGLPFGPDTLVFKVMDKIFAITGLDNPDCRVNLKCDPERAISLRTDYPEDVLPGYHMNKEHWNTVICDQGLPRQLVCDLIDHSYDLIVASLPAKRRAELDELG